MSSLARLPLFDRLIGARNVLVAGAGGGFDVYAGLPIAFAMAARGATVHLANYSFSSLVGGWIAPGLAEIHPDSDGDDDYFPERVLARWLGRTDRARPVYAFAPTGVVPLRRAYALLADRLKLDAVVLVDGGTDILMCGDEAGLGTPIEDMTSLAALHQLDAIPIRLVACIGFGIDAYHGVRHTQVLENIARLTREGGYVGAFSIPPDCEEARAYLDAVDDAAAATPGRPSIVNGQIAASLRGQFGDVRATSRTAGHELFVNPLMSVYLTFELDRLARSVQYIGALSDTLSQRDVALVIEEHRDNVTRRPARAYPH